MKRKSCTAFKEVVQLLSWRVIFVFLHSPLGESRPEWPERGALAGRYASISLGNRGLTPSG